MGRMKDILPEPGSEEAEQMEREDRAWEDYAADCYYAESAAIEASGEADPRFVPPAVLDEIAAVV